MGTKDLDRRIAPMGADAIDLLLRLGGLPVCSVTLAEELGFDGQRFADAVHDLRESGIRLATSDRETIRVAPGSAAEARARADRIHQRFGSPS